MAFVAPTHAACASAAPSFSHAVRAADRVVIGTVQDAQTADYSSAFILRIEATLRGEPAVFIQVRNLVANPICGTVVIARNGDRIAIAFNGFDFRPPTRLNAVAYISGEPPWEGVEVLTEDQIRELVQTSNIPDTALRPLTTSPRAAVGWLLVAAALCVVIVDASRSSSARPTRRAIPTGSRAHRRARGHTCAR